tara:strand:- start:633 stop:1112 length:480 start_codon:yes stop_codon:yes gene_type:complete
MKENGRVIFKENNQFLLSDQFRNKEEVTSYSNSMNGLWYNTSLSNSYFSAQNIKYIHDTVRHTVFKKTNHIIDKQNIDTIKNIMRSFFLKFSKNNKEDLKNQILVLNKLVIDFCVKEIIPSLESYLKYIDDVSNIPEPIHHPHNTGVKGEQPLELSRFY